MATAIRRSGRRHDPTGTTPGADDELIQRGDSILGCLAQHPREEPIQRRSVRPVERPRARDGLFPVGPEAIHEGLARVRRAAGQEIVERTAQAVDVRAMVGELGIRSLLGRDVVDRPDEDVALGQARLRDVGAERAFGDTHPRDAHVEDLQRAAGIEQQVRRLDVPMDDIGLIGGLEPSGRLDQAIDRPGDLHGPLLPDEPGEVGALDVFHHEEVEPAELVRVQDRDDVGVAEPGGGLRLAAEPGYRRRVSCQRRGSSFKATMRFVPRCCAFSTMPMLPAPAGRAPDSRR